MIIDVNLPPQSKEYCRKSWLLEIEKMVNDLAAEGYEDPCPANAIFFYNDPSHYLVDDHIGDESDTLWIKEHVPQNARTPHELTLEICDRILKAYEQRVHPPVNIPDM